MKKMILYSSAQLGKIKETGGVKRFKELARGLCRLCDLTVMSGDERLSFREPIRHISMHHSRFAKNELGYALLNWKYLLSLKKIKYDYLISFDVPPTLWLVLLRVPHICLMVRKDLIGYEKIILNGNNRNKVIAYIKIKLLLFAEFITMIAAERIIVQCEYDKKMILKRHKFFIRKLKEKIKVQINNVNPSWEKELQVSACSNRENGNSFVIGSINGFGDLRKGCDLFLEAAYRLIKRGEDVIAFIAGDGELIEKYKEKYKGCSRIIFLGRINEPNSFLSEVDLSVVPSRADSCPNTIMESLFMGVPVIASKSGGIPEILPLEEALFDLSVDSLEKKISELIYDKSQYNSLLEKELLRKKELEFDWCYAMFKKIIESE
ncbi:Glycosyltransferase involved in cell wall bisynthesis [Selenomonas ruminantium]|uniref:Glycosyltransferase involved in cell wall bisynthesis n=1 Tax=Selenomonas ruminantium TaxID=971 RepID=A0A1I3FN29_SELRU|nr:glycosyltransferase family 4 protein [Selenomonas ruminantium]SFI12678.1 Glycosyltransferase involved in cell wall bisynthesis [Selenomonas ruminantium]